VVAVDTNHDGRQDTWFIFEGSALRMHAADLSGDGRPDREDLYTTGRVTSRRLDNDADGRFETIETIEDDTIAGWMMDLDGDGRYESRSVKDAEGVHHVERDSDGDGRTDAWIMMIGEGAQAAVREQVDTDGMERRTPRDSCHVGQGRRRRAGGGKAGRSIENPRERRAPRSAAAAVFVWEASRPRPISGHRRPARWRAPPRTVTLRGHVRVGEFSPPPSDVVLLIDTSEDSAAPSGADLDGDGA
jgi:hypothetical protein